MADFWFCSPRPLMELADALERALGTTPFQYDTEDVWEWATAELGAHGIELDLSRKHRDGSWFEDEPVRITLSARDPAASPPAERWGPALAAALRARVRGGTITRLQNDELDYREEAVFEPR